MRRWFPTATGRVAKQNCGEEFQIPARKHPFQTPARKRLLGTAAALALIFASPAWGEMPATPPEQMKAVTYVSDAWVINFWNTESDHMEEELAQIAADGFNTIILAIPWREFQPETDPVRYNPYAFQKLDRVMEAAKEQGLWVRLRVSYTWDYYEEEESVLRFRQLLKEEELRKAWLDYLGQVCQAASAHENYLGGFITWEDFWNYMEDGPNLYAGQAGGGKEAEAIGYQDYLRAHYDLKEVSDAYNTGKNFTSYRDMGIPKKNSPAFKLFYEYYDDFLTKLLQEGQTVFPDLSMEVRLDVDPVKAKNGTIVGADHFATFPCGGASYTALMYSVSMGREAGSQLTAQQALDTMRGQLQLVKACNRGKPIFIDQLLYMDLTPGFESNARLIESERAPYLLGLADILRSYTCGYTVWCYWDYANNPLYNSQFALGNEGWGIRGGSVVERDGSHQLLLEDRGSATQKIGSRIAGKETKDNFVRFTADSDYPVTLRVSLGEKEQTVRVDGKEQYELNFGKLDYETLSFFSQGEVCVDNVYVYNFVQDGQVYDMDNQELSCLEAIRGLNRALGN